MLFIKEEWIQIHPITLCVYLYSEDSTLRILFVQLKKKKIL